MNDVADHPKVWQRLLKPGYVNEFVSLFQRFTVRFVSCPIALVGVRLIRTRMQNDESFCQGRVNDTQADSFLGPHRNGKG